MSQTLFLNNVIISYDDVVVKQETALEKWAQKKIKTDKVSEKMKLVGYYARGERMANCSDIVTYQLCPECGEFHVKRANLCRDRFCPICSWRLSLQRFGAMSRVMTALQCGYPEYKYSLATLTVKNCSADKLSETLFAMSSAWHLAINQRRVKAFVVGWARSVEITYNQETQEFHPHFHCILMTPPQSLADYALLAEWEKACEKKGLKTCIKAQNTTEIQAKDGEKLIKSILETIKYALKTDEMTNIPLKKFRSLVDGISKKRLFSSGGLIKEYMKNCGVTVAEMENATEENKDLVICNKCGTETLEIIYKWAFGAKRYEI